MKKTILTIGTMLTAIAPVITAVSCSGKEAAPKTDTKTEEIKRYFNYFKNTITIPKKTVITDNKTLLTAIKKSIGLALTDEQKNAISIVGEYSALVLDTAKEVKIEIKVGTEKTETVTLSITHKTTDADKQEAIINYFNKGDGSNKNIIIPDSYNIIDNTTLLTAINKTIGNKLTDIQKEAIYIEADYKVIKEGYKGSKYNVTISVHVGSNPTTNWLNLNVIQERIKLTSTLTKEEAIKAIEANSVNYNIYNGSLDQALELDKSSKLFAFDDSKGYNSRPKFKMYLFNQKKKNFITKPKLNNVIEALNKAGIKFKDEKSLQTELIKNFNVANENDIKFTKNARGGSQKDRINLFGYFFWITDDKKGKKILRLAHSFTFKGSVDIQSIDLNFKQ